MPSTQNTNSEAVRDILYRLRTSLGEQWPQRLVELLNDVEKNRLMDALIQSPAGL